MGAEHDAAHDEHCPFCRAYDVTPYRSEDRSVIVEPQGGAQGEIFVVLECAAVTTHGPDDRPLGRFPTRAAALAFRAAR